MNVKVRLHISAAAPVRGQKFVLEVGVPNKKHGECQIVLKEGDHSLDLELDLGPESNVAWPFPLKVLMRREYFHEYIPEEEDVEDESGIPDPPLYAEKTFVTFIGPKLLFQDEAEVVTEKRALLQLKPDEERQCWVLAA